MKRLILFTAGIFIALFSQAQLTVDASLSNTQLAQLITGSGISISNVSVDCQTTSSGKGYGKYHATATSLINISDGLLLTTGEINNAIGPNNSSSKTSYYGNNPEASNNSSNAIKALIQAESGKTIYEFCEFSFDIIPVGDTLKFNYAFASEEYNEYVNTNYNDAFAFYITGANPTGGNYTNKNIAIVPGTTQAVSINNVNNGQTNGNSSNPNGPCKNCQYFQNNPSSTTIQYDGFTKNLKAVAAVVPCQTYRLKLVVADAFDRRYDSGVFIEKITSTPAITIGSTTQAGTAFAIEACNPATVTFTRPSATTSSVQIPYFIAGTATNGTDYTTIGSVNNASVKYITIPANQTSASFVLNPVADGVAENEETIIFSLDNPGCPAGINVSHTLTVRDSIFPTLTPTTAAICAGQSVSLTGGAPTGTTYTWTPSTGLSNASISNPVATPSSTTLYTMSAKLASCVETRKTRVTVNSLPDVKVPTAPAKICLGSNTEVQIANAQNGINYQLKLLPSNTIVGTGQSGNGNTLSFNTGTLSSTTLFGITATNPLTTCTRQMASTVSVAIPAAPVKVALNTDQNTCLVNGNNWVTFIQDGTNRAIVSVNANGNNLGNVTATGYVDGTPIDVQACGNAQAFYTTAVMNRRWTITPQNQPSTPVDVRLYFSEAEFTALKNKANINQNFNDDVNTVAELVLSKYSGLNENGSFADNCGNGTTALFEPTNNGNNTSFFSGFDANGRYIQFTVPGFSEFWLHGNSNTNVSPLPIVLTDFDADCAGENIDVKWTTATEINNAFFVISRSADAITWETVEVVAGAGNSNQERNYSIVDTRPLTGTSYYRLHQVDLDGTIEYFDPISISCSGKNAPEISIYPNPVDEQFTVSVITDNDEKDILINIYDITGKVVITRNIQILQNASEIVFDINGLSSGTYFVKILMADKEVVQKIILR